MKDIELLEEAVADIESARDFYDRQEPGVGRYFVQSILSDLERLRFIHGIHVRRAGFLRMMAGRFPFGIYYRVNTHAIQVFAILDLRQNPSWIRAELTDRGQGSR